MASVSIVCLLLSIYMKRYIQDFVEYDEPWRMFVHFSISLIVIFTAIWKYAQIAEQASSKKDTLIKEVNRKNVELERFAYITSHDLKQPVRNITSFAGLLERNLMNAGDNVKSLEYTKFIKSSSESLEQLINDILKLSKLGTEEFVSEEVDLNATIQRILKSMEFYIKSRNGEVTIDKLPVLKSSNIYLTLLFQNLIENSLKYNKSANPSVELRYNEGTQYHIISVIDNGLGISEEYFDIIFQPFKRLHSNKTYQGSGLGLSICKKIVDMLGGNISLKSQVGQGSEFVIELPK